MSATVEKAKANWTGYWQQPGVAESFGGKEELEKNPKYYLEEKPIVDQIPNCKSILDAGCGVGRYASLVRGKSKVYVGVDFSQKMISRAIANNPQAEKISDKFSTLYFFQGDLEFFDFQKALQEIGLYISTLKGVVCTDGEYIKEAKFDIGLLIAIIRHLPYEKGLAVLKHVADSCKTLFFTATIIDEAQEVPMVVKGIGSNLITDHPYHLNDLKKALGVDTLFAIPIGDRDPTEGKRYLFRFGEEPPDMQLSKKKPWNRVSTVRRAISG